MDRAYANRVVAWWWEVSGRKWSSIKQALPHLEAEFGFRALPGERRSPRVIRLAEAIVGRGHVLPERYTPPWRRMDSTIRHPARLASAKDSIKAFYQSVSWRRLRYEVLRERGAKCECCGHSRARGARIVVDHIEPVKAAWGKRFDRTNLQVLCEECNIGKGSHDTTDWRQAIYPRARVRGVYN